MKENSSGLVGKRSKFLRDIFIPFVFIHLLVVIFIIELIFLPWFLEVINTFHLSDQLFCNSILVACCTVPCSCIAPFFAPEDSECC